MHKLPKHFFIYTFIFASMFRPVCAQQYSFTSGSDLFSSEYAIHVTVGHFFVANREAIQFIEEGLLSVLFETMVLGTSEKDSEISHISPNPFVDHVELYVPGASVTKPVSIRIYSLQGYLVEETTMEDSRKQVFLRHLMSGTYLVRIQPLGAEAKVFKVIKSI
jgi:hypothetical protein